MRAHDTVHNHILCHRILQQITIQIQATQHGISYYIVLYDVTLYFNVVEANIS